MNSAEESLNHLTSITDYSYFQTYGSFIAQSLSEWTKQVVELVQSNTFNPRPIRRELKSILHLFTDKNFKVSLTYICCVSNCTNRAPSPCRWQHRSRI